VLWAAAQLGRYTNLFWEAGAQMAERNEDISRLFYRITTEYEEHSKRIGDILESAQGKFRQDFALACASTGAVSLLGGIAVALLGRSIVVAIIGSSAGTILLIAAMIFRARSSMAQVQSAHMFVELERERAKFAQQSAMCTEIWLHGPPAGLEVRDALQLIAPLSQVGDHAESSTSDAKLLSGGCSTSQDDEE
jgi:hypothetical protein